MRTSTGSIRVMKMPQKNSCRIGKRKYTIAKADSREMAILPTAMIKALTRLTTIMRPTATLVPGPVRSPESALW